MIIMEPDRRLQMLRSENSGDIIELTQLVARNAFPKGSAIMTMRDNLGQIFEDKAFADLCPNLGQLAESPGRLAQVKGATLEPRLGVKMIVRWRTGKEKL
jgi:hypothetical protein